MPKFKVELIRTFYASETSIVEIKADTSSEAERKAKALDPTILIWTDSSDDPEGSKIEVNDSWQVEET